MLKAKIYFIGFYGIKKFETETSLEVFFLFLFLFFYTLFAILSRFKLNEMSSSLF